MSSTATSRRRPLPPASPSRRLRACLVLTLFLVSVVGAAVIGWRFAEASKPITGPIILVSIDTLRADRLSIYGSTRVPTPNLDRLAREGVVFEHAYAHSPQTLPSHASMLTGLLPFEHGVRDDFGFTLGPDSVTLAGLLEGRGFETGAAVSAYVLRPETGLAKGFATYDAGPLEEGPDTTSLAIDRDGTETVEAAASWIEAVQSPRFFYFLHLDEPHQPYAPPARFADFGLYEGEIAYADEILGRLLAALDRKGLYEKALIIVTSDHGEGLGEHGEHGHGLFLYDEVLRVPLVIKMPDGNDARRVAAPVQHIDLVPTILDLVRAPWQEHLRGRSLRALLEDDEDTPLDLQGIYAESLYGRFHFGLADLYSLTEDGYRFIQAPRPELYDLSSADKAINLAASQTGTAKAMAEAIDVLLKETSVEPPAPLPHAAIARLPALGYPSIAPTPMGNAATSEPTDPKDLAAYVDAYRRAMALAGAGNVPEAAAALEAAASAQPEMADVWRQVGAFELADGRPKDAIRSFERFTRLRPDRPEGLLATARILFDLGRLEEARKLAELAFEAAPPDEIRTCAAIAELAIRVALAQKDTRGARRIAAEAQASYPALALGPYVEGRLLHQRGDFDGALPLLEEAVGISAHLRIHIGGLQWYIGDTLTRLNRFAEAEKAFRSALSTAPNDVRAYTSLATLYHVSNRDEAVAKTLAALERAVPTPEGLAAADRLRTTFAGAKILKHPQ